MLKRMVFNNRKGNVKKLDDHVSRRLELKRENNNCARGTDSKEISIMTFKMIKLHFRLANDVVQHFRPVQQEISYDLNSFDSDFFPYF